MSEKGKRITLRPSAELAGAQTEYGGNQDAALVSSTATATTADKLVDTVANFTTADVAVGDIIHNVTDGTYALVTAVDSATQLSIGTDIMAQDEVYEIISGDGLVLPDIGINLYRQATIILDVTAAATASGDHLDVYIDTSFDGGTSWVNLGRFTQLDGDGGAKTYIMTLGFDADQGATAITDVSADAAEGATRQIGIGGRLRYRAVNTEASDVAYTFSIKGFLT